MYQLNFDFLKQYCITALLLFPLRLERYMLRSVYLEDGSSHIFFLLSIYTRYKDVSCGLVVLLKL